MKKLKYSKKIVQETLAFSQMIETYCDKLNKEYLKMVYTVIQNIADGEKLDFNMLKKKYLNNSNVITEENTFDDETILDKQIIDGVAYYYEKTDNGKVYDSESNIVGNYINDEIILNSSAINVDI